MKKHLLISDLDGTLLNGKQEISMENKKSIQQFIKNGGLFTIATGRIEKSVYPYVEELGITLPVILYNGAVIYDYQNQKRLFEQKISHFTSLFKRLQAFSDSHAIGINYYQNEQAYVPDYNEFIKEHEKKDKVEVKEIDADFDTSAVTKVLVISDDPAALKHCEKLVQCSGVPCDTVYSDKIYLEILPKNVSKGNAVKELLKYINRSDLHITCVGDHENDLSMLQIADTAYVVENAITLLKQQNFRETVHHEHHAIQSIIGEISHSVS
ncbi:Cof-type HAD-IIB family hydrolase [Oceanobacillus sp. CFH 90083]|uniref:Cof-type HAD-IIB family hydrolase n=1 Tax=Oceanobacillus sp. CFH 90083 TaxID=2592336 RepID=UPI0018832DE9|nr:Cof-type HAD-IIB family hydrolase [Oceanobacillus sp. CFH 90083]